MGLIIMVMGLPGSGKSFFARRLSISLNAVYLGSDELRKQMGMMGKYQKQHKFKVYEVMIQEAENHLQKDLIVVLDATFYLKAIREKVAEIAKKNGAVCIPILVEAEEAVIKGRLSKPRADSEADWEVYQKLKTEFEPLDGPLLALRSDNENIDAMIDQAMQYINLHYGKS